MKHNKGNGNIIEKKATYQEHSDEQKKKKQSAKLDKITMKFDALNNVLQKTAQKQQHGTSLAFYMLIRTSGARW